MGAGTKRFTPRRLVLCEVRCRAMPAHHVLCFVDQPVKSQSMPRHPLLAKHHLPLLNPLGCTSYRRDVMSIASSLHFTPAAQRLRAHLFEQLEQGSLPGRCGCN